MISKAVDDNLNIRSAVSKNEYSYGPKDTTNVTLPYSVKSLVFFSVHCLTA